MSLKAMNSFIIVEEISETKSSTGMIMGNPSSDIIKGVVSATSVDTVSVGDTVYFIRWLPPLCLMETISKN